MKEGGQAPGEEKPVAPAGQVTNAQAADKAERNTIDVEARQKP
jgi:sec-independent protein translocase protein TatA